MRGISLTWKPLVMWKSVRSMASYSSQYSSLLSIRPYLLMKNATARYTSSKFLQAADLVVFMQGALEFGQEDSIGLIADAEDAQAVIAQLTAELPVVAGTGRKRNFSWVRFILFRPPSLHWINTRALPESVTNSIAKWVSRGSRPFVGAGQMKRDECRSPEAEPLVSS